MFLGAASMPGKKTKHGPSNVVLLPSKELVQQVEKVAQQQDDFFAKGSQTRLRPGLCVVATPASLPNLLRQRQITMSGTECLVVFEANDMLKMGFGPQLRHIESQLHRDTRIVVRSIVLFLLVCVRVC